MTRLITGPFNRVEGELEVKLDVTDNMVASASVNSPLFRGFERMLHGKDPMDALVLVPRICGICSVSQSMAAAAALAKLTGVETPRNGNLAANLVLACENIADHLTHFYLFFMPDFTREIYAQEPWFAEAHSRFAAVHGRATQEVLPARAELLHITGLLAGKWPHTLAVQPGGTTKAVAINEKLRLTAILHKFRRFLEATVFGADLDEVGALKTLADLQSYRKMQASRPSDFAGFLNIAEALNLEHLGRSADRFMSFGAYELTDGHVFKSGVVDDTQSSSVNLDLITEDVSHAWMQGDAQHPFEGTTQPDTEMKEGYSWCKAPRLGGKTIEVGALARQLIDGQPLMKELVQAGGGNVLSRVAGRLMEVARLVPLMQEWVSELEPEAPFRNHPGQIPDGQAMGLVEAARGALGHWLRVENGKIANYQIIAPTTWNFSPRDAQGVPGPLEQALVGAPVRKGETDPVAVQHIIRSFDPCMFCTVH